MSLLQPNAGLVFWMLLAFGIVFFILAKFAWPFIIGAAEKRSNFIADSVKSAEESNKQLANIKIEAENIRIHEEELALKDSLTPRAKQLHWKIPTEFPLCPSVLSDSPLQDYLTNLVRERTFCQNSLYHSKVVKAELSITIRKRRKIVR